ncbi:hypothetical protein BAUCODRAFT_37314 [Baudoinia panamericana UAMH 10762]|uniref:Uncharacterized protein n=1 Tax=Baudoinia panamericana (strain UAMH 10762) TaxID=717646 RepID=M2LHI5_BAUPA|nr:uncharacterized protein BAUCODRAFT_37314 [Baudoinia panamericana UAMH 10762]EMC93627.1 hypothetical protein BAUCODRAFT_37314 [Baudoinia panamericana UAMH 10762]
MAIRLILMCGFDVSDEHEGSRAVKTCLTGQRRVFSRYDRRSSVQMGHLTRLHNQAREIKKLTMVVPDESEAEQAERLGWLAALRQNLQEYQTGFRSYLTTLIEVYQNGTISPASAAGLLKPAL